MALIDQLQALPAQWEAMARDWLTPLKEEAKLLFTRAKEPLDSAFRLGEELLLERQFEEAKIRFKFVLWRNPVHALALYKLSVCHLALHEKHEGLQALNKSLTFDPKNEMALYLKATYEDGKYADGYAPHTTPTPFILSKFTKRAAKYNLNELEKGYRGASELYDQILTLGITPESILEVGCGTGLCGGLLSTLTDKLIGVDICPAMIEEAQELEFDSYAEFIEADLRDHLLLSPNLNYELIVAANVISITGGIAAVMDGAAKGLKPGGYFIFTALALRATEGYRYISDIQRFAHSSHYLKTQAERAGLKAISLREVTLYEDDPRPSYMVVLQK
ncbi:MAG: methyltransferase domain-containing protein [Rickettsiales bacterium]|nr:methyltransferase domain-containing protein [Rickettsiales bacterium]